MTFADSDTEGNTPFSTLNLSYAIISIFATLKIIWQWRRFVSGQYQWYKNRQNRKIIDEANVETGRNIDAKTIPFNNYCLGPGEGKRKIGTQLRLQEDVYSVLFCSLIKAEY